MSIIRGFDRIFLIISILSIILSLYLLPDFVSRELTVETDEYRDYDKKIRNDIKNTSDDEVQKWKDDYCNKKNEEFKRTGRVIPLSPGDPTCSDSARRLYGYHKYNELISKAPTQIRHPPAFQVIGISFIVAVIGASILFFILKGTTRLIKWVVDGFRSG